MASSRTSCFENGDVREQFIGEPWETAEWIRTERIEASASWLHEFNGRYNASLSVGYSEHDQDSFYEGFDYEAVDELLYLDFRNNLAVSDAHLLTFGIDRRDEEMRSNSAAGAASDVYVEDSFDYLVTGLYLQDSWRATDRLDLLLALRLDDVKADFVAPEKPGTEIDKTVVAPRLDLRYRHTDAWASRFLRRSWLAGPAVVLRNRSRHPRCGGWLRHRYRQTGKIDLHHLRPLL